MPENTKRDTRRDAEQNKRAFIGASATAIVLGLFAIGAYYLFHDPENFRESERQRVVVRIEQFREQCGAYPKDSEQIRPFISDAFSLGYYVADKEEFCIELTRSRWFPPGQTTWAYCSKSGEWNCYSETW